jgi:hypothetical protein
VNKRANNRIVVAVLLLAGALCYADAPRLSAWARMGDTLNAARVLDVVSHIRLAAKAADSEAHELREDLEEGRRSLEIITASPQLLAAVPATLRYQPPKLGSDDDREGLTFDPNPTVALPGAVLNLSLPPPLARLDAAFSPWSHAGPVSRALARAPPLA